MDQTIVMELTPISENEVNFVQLAKKKQEFQNFKRMNLKSVSKLKSLISETMDPFSLILQG